MTQKDPRAIQAALSLPFAPEDIDWRLQQTFQENTRGIAVPYVTNRAIQNRLDEVVGQENWYNDYRPWHGTGKKEAQICGISIYFEGRGFITKWDGSEDSDIEPIKGGLSDSMKRAAVQWGIGRYLYSLEAAWVDTEPRGKSAVMKKGARAKLDQFYCTSLKKLGLVLPNSIAPTPPTEPEKSRQDSTPKKPSKPVQKKEPAPQSIPYEYLIRDCRRQKGMSSVYTQVILEARDGKTVTALANGEHPALVSGAYLHSVKLTVRKQDTVIFHVLEAYQIVSTPQQAA